MKESEIIKAQNKTIRDYIVELNILKIELNGLKKKKDGHVSLSGERFDDIWYEENPHGANWARRKIKKAMGFYEDN